MKKCIIFSFSILFALLLACTDEGLDEMITPKPGEDNVTYWIEQVMRKDYLWYDELPDKSSLDFKEEPMAFFKGLLSLKDGKEIPGGHLYFSNLQKVPSSKAINNEDDSYGFDFAVGNIKDGTTTHKIALVTYVLHNSPAEEAGLKRGDWIVGVNGTWGSIKDYNQLRSGGNVTLQLGNRVTEGEISLGEKRPIGASRAVENTPFLKDTVHHFGDRHIGYLAYNKFMLGPNKFDLSNRQYLHQMEKLFKKFKEQHVNEFVLDLRYNGGGYMDCAQLLASLLAPQEVLTKTFCYFKYNDKNRNQDTGIKFLNTSTVLANNLNLKRLYVLTGRSSASASELIINNLRPFMPVKTIGSITLGKTVGMSVYDGSEKYGWILSPVTFWVSNFNHEADYENGISPNIEKNEYNYDLVDFGEVNEPLFEEALRDITGQPALRATKANINLDMRHETSDSFFNNLLQIHND